MLYRETAYGSKLFNSGKQGLVFVPSPILDLNTTMATRTVPPVGLFRKQETQREREGGIGGGNLLSSSSSLVVAWRKTVMERQ